MGMLTLTFRGPFLFVVPPATGGVLSPTVDIYAPICSQHLGSVFFGDRSLSIFGNPQNGSAMQYVVRGVAPNPGVISFQWNFGLSTNSIFVSPDSSTPPVAAKLNPSFAYFRVTAPRPKIFYAMDMVTDTEVVKSGTPTNTFNSLLTAFRLYYDWDAITQITLTAPPNVSAVPFAITPPAGQPHPGSPASFLPLADTGDVEFEYEGPGMADPDHQDASSCFNQLALLAGLNWFLNFDNSGGSGGAQFHTGSDCTAVPLILGLNN
jgi:hypothetical protein